MTGRDIEPHELAIAFDGSSNGWQRLCEAEVDVRTAPLKAGLSAAEQEVYELLEEMGEADAGTLAKGLGKHRTSVLKTLKRLRAQGSVEAREVATHNRGGRKILFRIAEEGAEALAAGRLTQRAHDSARTLSRLCTLSTLSAVCGIW